MNEPQKTNGATDDVASAEAELRAAQEALEAAKARLAQLKDEHPPVMPGEEAAGESAEEVAEDAAVEDESAEDAADDAAEVTAVIDVEPVSCEVEEVEVVDGEEEPAPASDEEGADEASGESEPAKAEAVPDWIPYSTASAPAAVPTPEPVPATASAASTATATAVSSDVPPVPPTYEAQPVGAPTPTPGPVPPPPAGASYQQQPPTQQPGGYAAPGYGQPPHAGPGAVPPQQPYYNYQQPYYQQPYAQPVLTTKDHVAAGLLAIFLGSLGIHKFYLGYNTAGFIMLAVTIVGSIFTLGLAAGVMGIIGIIEGILYLTKSQTEFEQIYVVNQREWF